MLVSWLVSLMGGDVWKSLVLLVIRVGFEMVGEGEVFFIWWDPSRLD